MRQRLKLLLEAPWIVRGITALIVFNAVTLGLETSTVAMALAGDLLLALDRIVLAVFVAELAAKMFAYGRAFWRDPWNLFDSLVVGIALLPASGPLAVLRALRVLRVLRLVNRVPSMRGVVEALLRAIPGMGSILALLALIFYVSAVMTTKLWGDAFPELFGTLGASAYTLFQVMTLEGWSAEIVRPLMAQSPYAWLFFVPFILLTTFAVLNLFVAIVVNAMQQRHEAGQQAALARADEQRQDLTDNVLALRAEVAELKRLVQQAR